MKNKSLIFAAVIFQCCIIVGLFAKAFYPLMWGQEVTFRANANDPRDIFRGNYSVLRYNFTEINLDSIPNDLQKGHQYNFGDVFYLELEKVGEFYETKGLWLKKPENKLAMRVLCNYTAGNYINIKGGIESYFTNPERAKEIDDMLMNGRDSAVVAVQVMLAYDGHARIKDLKISSLKKP